MINQELLKELFNYDQETGIFTRLKVNSSCVKVGQKAGSVHKYTGYMYINIGKKKYLVHRLAWLYVYGVMPLKDLDHINGNTTDNRICNLREVTMSENKMNIGLQKNNKTGFKGVFFDKRKNKYLARAKINKQSFDLGSYETAKEASDAYIDFCKRNHGEFYRDIENHSVKNEINNTNKRPALHEGKTVSEWAEIFGITKQSVRERLQRNGTVHL